MRETSSSTGVRCRRCLTRFRSGRKSFFVPGARVHYAPDLPFRLESLTLDVAVDPVARTLCGTVKHRLRAVAPGREEVRLDQVDLAIEEARVGNVPAKFVTEGHALRVLLTKSPASGELIEVSVRFRVKQPRRGLYFTGPDADYPSKPYQVWSQGQDEDNRHWFPSFDFPNQKALSEVIATVPKGYTAVSNGALLSKQDVDQGTRFHYKLGVPHVNYLITLVVGQFVEWADQGPRGLPVQYFVAPGREADGKRAFSNTPKMIEAFEKRIGENYPYEKYSQVAVQDFIFGGMENTSATTQTDLTLHDERAHLDFTSDPLVSHELAHQWFGDLLTCRDWSHGWLNEGFATFFERIWVEADTGPHGGWDEAKYYAYADLKEHLDEDESRYRRPIVCNSYIEPIDLFDTHLYHKGGLVLNLIRHTLGEEGFWKSIGLYVKRHRGQNVETIDLIRAIEDATGRNLRRLFDEWVFGAGCPELELSYSWNEEKKLAELVIEQKQTNGQPALVEDGVTTHLFHLPVTVELTLEDGKKVKRTVEIGEARERVFIEAAAKPLMVRFDPENWIPKKMKFPRPKEMLLYQLENDSDCMGRIEAALELAKLGEPDVVPALAKATSTDAFWGVRAEAAAALGSIRTTAARDALIAALSAQDASTTAKATAAAKARRAIVRALGTFKDAPAAEALKKLADKDASYFVEADAIYGWVEAKLRPELGLGAEGATAIADEVEAYVLRALDRPSYREAIRGGALKALTLLPGIGAGERPTALQALMDWTRRGKVFDARVQAIQALGRVVAQASAPVRAAILALFSGLADEDSFRIRFPLVHALARSGSPLAISTLEKIRQLDADGRVRRDAQGAIADLLSSGGVPESVQTLKSSFEKLEEEHRKLKAAFEEFRSAPSAK